MRGYINFIFNYIVMVSGTAPKHSPLLFNILIHCKFLSFANIRFVLIHKSLYAIKFNILFLKIMKKKLNEPLSFQIYFLLRIEVGSSMYVNSTPLDSVQTLKNLGFVLTSLQITSKIINTLGSVKRITMSSSRFKLLNYFAIQ